MCFGTNLHIHIERAPQKYRFAYNPQKLSEKQTILGLIQTFHIIFVEIPPQLTLTGEGTIMFS